MGRWLGNQPDSTQLVHTGVPENEGVFLANDIFQIGTDAAKPGDFALAKRNRMENVTADPENILKEWRPYVEDPKAKWLVEKSPIHCTHHPFLRRTFPDSWHICVVRHPIPVVNSTWKMQQSWGGTTDHATIAYNWMEGIKTFIADTENDDKTGLLVLNSTPTIPKTPFPLATKCPYTPRTDRTHFQKKRSWKLPSEVVDFMGRFGFKDKKPWH